MLLRLRLAEVFRASQACAFGAFSLRLSGVAIGRLCLAIKSVKEKRHAIEND